MVKPFLDHLVVQTADNLITILFYTTLYDKSDVVLLHFGTNDILSNANDTELANNITLVNKDFGAMQLVTVSYRFCGAEFKSHIHFC